MSDISSSTPDAVLLEDPFHGRVGISARLGMSGRFVHLVVSIDRAWDADILINPEDTLVLASALGDPKLHITRAHTADDAAVILISQGDRLVVTIPGERISDVLLLRTQLEAVRECLRAAAAG